MADNYYGITDTGRVRDNNEDTFVAQALQRNNMVLAGVIDGVGGYNGGEIAAEIARDQFIKHLSKPAADWQSAMANAFKQANDEIYTRKQQVKELDSMACVATLAVADIENNQFYYAHVGDTRLYLLRDHSLVKITKDHSFVGFLEDSGRLTENAAMTHPKRNEINKALGFNHTIGSEKDYIEFGQSPFLPGDMLLICSDGLTDMVDKSEITAIITNTNSLQRKAQQLIAAANDNGGRDNVTVVLVENNKKPLQQNATMPVSNARQAVTPQTVVPASEPSPVLEATSSDGPTQPNSKTGIIILLSILCVVFLGAAAWFYWQNTQQKAEVATQATQAAKKPRNAQEAKLQDTINKVKGDTLLLTNAMFTQPVLITDSITINKDTLYIKTQGQFQLNRDSAYNGPAITLAPTCKLIVLNGLVLNGFNTGVATYNNALQLKHVQFINVTRPVQVSYALPGQKPVNASIPDIKFTTDTSSISIKTR